MTFASILRFFGKHIITPFFSIGTGIVTTVAVSSLSIVSGLSLPLLIVVLGLVFISDTLVSFLLFEKSVPQTLVDIFVRNIFKGLTPIKKALLSIGMVCALGGGFAIAVLTLSSSAMAIATVLSLMSLSFPPLCVALAIALAMAGFIATSCLFIKWIATAIRHDLHLQVLQFFRDIFFPPSDKAIAQHALESTFKLLFTSAICLLTVLSTIVTLGLMQQALAQFLLLIPNANALAVTMASSIIVYAMTGVARLPWVLQSVCQFASFVGEKLGYGIYYVGKEMGIVLGLTEPDTLNEASYSWQEMAEFVIKDLGEIAIKSTPVIINSLCAVAAAKSYSGKVGDFLTDTALPLDAASINTISQKSLMVADAATVGSISGYTLFSESMDAKRRKEELDVLFRQLEVKLS